MEKESLKEWYIKYRKNRDLMLKKIDEVINKDDNVVIKNKDGTEEVIIIHSDVASIKDILKPFDKENHIITVVLNKKAHIGILLKEWEHLIKYPGLTVMFVNPDASTDKKWLVKPAIHDRITEKAALKRGIISIAEAVELC